MVDTVDLAFGEHGADFIVNLLRRGEIVTERFLQHDAAVGQHQACGSEVAADGGEQSRRGGQIEHTRALRVLLQLRGQRGVAGGIGGIDTLVVDTGGKLLPGGDVEFGAEETLGMLARACDIVCAACFGARDAYDTHLFSQQSVTLQVIERGQQLAHHQIAGGAEQDQIQTVYFHCRFPFVCFVGAREQPLMRL